MQKPMPECIVDLACPLAEGPLWHPLEKRLYWVDIPSGRLYRFAPDSGELERFETGAALGGFTIQADGGLLLFGARGRVSHWQEGETRTVIEEISEEAGGRFNDVIAGPEGGVYCGTLAEPGLAGNLYYLAPDGRLKKVWSGTRGSNGMGFTDGGVRMYYAETLRRAIYRFDVLPGGELANRAVFVTFPDGGGMPDGLTVDREGYVWVALWDGSALARFDPQGNEVMRVEFPCRKVSSVTFGGEDYQDLYVTTAGGDNRAAEGSGAGAIFRLWPGVRGVPEYFSRVG